MWHFKKKPKDWGSVWITPYLVSYSNGDCPQEIKETCSKISAELDKYSNIMIEYGRKISKNTGWARLQMIEASYDTQTGNISVCGSGDRFFSWNGTLEQFFSNNIMPENKLLMEDIKEDQPVVGLVI